MATGIEIKKKLAILNEGANVTTDATSIDFVGSGVNTSTVGNDVTVNIPGNSGNTTYYFNYSVPVGSFSEFSSLPTSATEQVIPWSVDPGVTEVAFQFETPLGVPNTTQIPAGLWQFFLHFNSLGVNENWIIRPQVYKIDISNVETLLFTADPEIVNNMPSVTTMYTCDGVFPATTLLTTDRLLIKISLQNTGLNTQTLNFRTEGSQHYSVGLTTLNQVVPTGAVTSVTGTAPIVSSGGTTPAISIPLATGSANGYLSSSDWSVFNAKQNAITLTTTGTSGAATLVGSTLNVPNYATSSGGVCGIANSSGVYTYYATLSLAMTAAVSGQTVDLLTDITETGSVTITTKQGVKINGNGYTYTLSVNDDTHAITYASSPIEMFNLKVVRTGRAANAGGFVFSKIDTGGLGTLKCQNVVFESTYGGTVRMFYGAIYGLTVNSYGTGIDTGNSAGNIYNCTVTSTAGIGIYNNDTSEIANCNVTGATSGISSTFGYVYNTRAVGSSVAGISATRVVNSTGVSSTGTGISAGNVFNSTGISASSTGVVATNGYNCVGISTSGVGLSGTFTNSTGISTSGFAGSGGAKTNCTLISSSNYGSNLENLNNCFLQSTTNVPLWLNSSKLVNSCTVLCLWDNVGGHAVNTSAASTGIEIRNCNLTVTNASAYCLNSPLGSTFKYASNTYKGSTTAVNTTNITQGITNTSDNQGNILI